ncbi:transposable element Tc3 transposase [Trichonephila clavipes]|nr:transposable element Tc3 transposase [Trichonephila clavipes]
MRNLVSIIQELTEGDFWKHVNSENNPADILSRGAEATLANIRNSFWITSTRNVVRKILRTCITCRKVSAKGSQQLMADLPAARVTACRVFSQVVKAIHLEIVSDLTTEAFLAALKRFVARRGRPIEIHSDNGRNFVGANNELRKIFKTLFKVTMEEIMDFLSKEQIKWNFNPPSAPHFVQIEAVLNSRPICPLSNDPNDVETLTTAHFLVGSSLVAVPDPDYTEIPMNRLSRWQLVQKMNQHFWRKWSSEYLVNRQQKRPKWCKGNVGFKEGDLVLVKPSENSDGLKWHLTRILKLHPDVFYDFKVRRPDCQIHAASSLTFQGEVEKLAYQLNEEAERTERPTRRLSKMMYGSTCADMQVVVMGECLSSIKHVVGTTSGCFFPRSNNWEVGGRPECDKCGCRVRNCSQHRFTTLETISNYRNSYPGFSSGHPRGTTPADDRYIVLQARRNRRQTAGEIARHTTQATGRPISRFTVARRLHGGGLFARRPVRCVPLTPAHRRRRSLWCREHRNWRDNEWGRVLLTDESRFSFSGDSHRILIWRERGSRNHPSNIIERDRYGGRGVLVWGGIMLGSRTDLHIFDAGSVNGTCYCNEILLPYVRLFRSAMGLQFLFMDDNAPCHRTVAAEQLLQSRRLAARTLPPVTIRGASIGAARRMGSNASTTH